MMKIFYCAPQWQAEILTNATVMHAYKAAYVSGYTKEKRFVEM